MSSVEQTMMDRMLHSKFCGNWPACSRKEDFEGFLPYMDVAAILVMRPASFYQIFLSLYLKAFILILVQNNTVVSEKIHFEFLYVHDLVPRSRNDLDLQYSHTFKNSIRCLLLPICRSLAAILSGNTLFPVFFLWKSSNYKI